jgi:hypothetical protein
MELTRARYTLTEPQAVSIYTKEKPVTLQPRLTKEWGGGTQILSRIVTICEG